jgi:hypothetical protein
MASKSRDEIRRADFLKVTTATGVITNVIAPNGLQIGLDEDEFRSALKSYGGISGSLTHLVDGTSYLIAGENVSIISGSAGAITISATSTIGTSTLTDGNGIANFSFDGTQAASVAVLLTSNSGLDFESGGIEIDFSEVSDTSRTAQATDGLLVDAGGTLAKTTVQKILDLVTTTPTALSNPLRAGFGLGFKDGIAYSNTNKSNYLGVKVQSTRGIASGSSGLKIDPGALSSITLSTSDRLLVGDADNANQVGYVTAQDMIDLFLATPLESLTVSDGLELNSGTTYNGGTARTITAKPNAASATIAVASSGISVLKVPNTLSHGNGISTFSFDGSGNTTVSIDLMTNSGMSFSSGELLLDVDDLIADSSPLIGCDMALSYGVGATRKVSLNNIRTLFYAPFNGNLVVSGTVDISQYAMAQLGFSGSLTRLYDGSSYLVAGPNVTIASQSNGQIKISSIDSFFNSPASGFLSTTGSTAFAGALGHSYKSSDIGNDTVFFVSGTIGSKNSTTRGLAAFGGDVVISGSLTVPSLSASLTQLNDGSSYLVAGASITITTQSNGQVLIGSTAGSGDASAFFNSPASGFLTTTGSISFAGALGTTYKTSDIGSDTVFFVSGTIGSKNSSIRGTSVFGGDTFISGTLSALEGLSGSLTTLMDGNPYLLAGSNISISTGSSGAVTITGAAGSSLSIISGSTTISTVDTINMSKLGVVQNLGSGDIAITGSIGIAEDGTYGDGLFTDFTESTPVGTAVDRFNEVLKGLAPSAAPALDDINCSDSGTSAVLSFGASQSIGGYTNSVPSALTPTDNLSDININGTFSSAVVSNDVRVACFDGTIVIDGTLNADASADSPNYATGAFGNGNQGTLKLFVNNNSTEIHSTDLSSFGSGTDVNGNGSGFVLSAVINGAFSDGSSFSTFKHRTGTYTIVTTDQRSGWNYARVVHTISGIDTTCNYIEWVNDPDSNALAAAGSVLDTLSMTGTKNLSGVTYNTGGTAQYRVRVSNAYRNVYSTSNITFAGTNCAISSQAFPVIDYGSGESETKVLHVTGSATINSDPLLNESISTSINVPAPLKSNLSSAGSQSVSGILLYDLSDNSTSTSETFRGEGYRISSGSYANQASVSDAGNTWNSTTSLIGVDGLLFYNSRLYAPVQGGSSGDFRNTSDGGSITNGPSSNVDYSSLTSGLRTFYRYFTNTSGGSKSNFTLTMNGSGTIVSQGTSLSTGNISVLLKLPLTSATFSTGWMDITVAFATGQTGDGAGCLDGSLDSSLNATNGVTFGTQFVGAGEYIAVKIEADGAFAGYLSSMSISWS